jgi:hypothetical protein
MSHETHDPNQDSNSPKLDSTPQGADIDGLRVVATAINTTSSMEIQPIPKIDALDIKTREFGTGGQSTEEIHEIPSSRNGHREVGKVILDVAMLFVNSTF